MLCWLIGYVCVVWVMLNMFVFFGLGMMGLVVNVGLFDVDCVMVSVIVNVVGKSVWVFVEV